MGPGGLRQCPKRAHYGGVIYPKVLRGPQSVPLPCSQRPLPSEPAPAQQFPPAEAPIASSYHKWTKRVPRQGRIVSIVALVEVYMGLFHCCEVVRMSVFAVQNRRSCHCCLFMHGGCAAARIDWLSEKATCKAVCVEQDELWFVTCNNSACCS